MIVSLNTATFRFDNVRMHLSEGSNLAQNPNYVRGLMTATLPVVLLAKPTHTFGIDNKSMIKNYDKWAAGRILFCFVLFFGTIFIEPASIFVYILCDQLS